MALPPQRVEDVERRVGVRRVLHVDAHEEPVRIGRLEDAAHVVDRGGPVDVEPELRQLQRDVALDAGRDDRVDDLHVVGGRRRAAVGARHAFAEVVERQEQALAGQVRRRTRSLPRSVSPAMKRRAKPDPGAIPYFEASRCSVGTCASPWNRAFEVASSI